MIRLHGCLLDWLGGLRDLVSLLTLMVCVYLFRYLFWFQLQLFFSNNHLKLDTAPIATAPFQEGDQEDTEGEYLFYHALDCCLIFIYLDLHGAPIFLSRSLEVEEDVDDVMTDADGK